MKRHFRNLPACFASLFLLLVSPALLGQVRDNGPTTVVITYLSPPENRAAFRALFETEGVRQFDQWKKDGVFRDYQILASSFTGENIGHLDIAVILQFASFVDVAKWQAVDRRMPGGLSPAALALGHADRTSLAFSVGHGEAKVRNPEKAAYILGLYEILVDDEAYTKYAKGYVEPQLKGWLDGGSLSGYAMYQSQPGGTKPTGAPWSFLLVLEYADMAALGDSTIVKDKVRLKLLADPAWKALSADKGEKRKARGFVFAHAITMPALRSQGSSPH